MSCYSKIIGARYYGDSYQSARDEDGHGSHAASIAAGNIVNDVSFFGLAQGTAKGGVPSARIATYRICQPDMCDGDRVLAAFDDAIADGVDIISISIGIGRLFGDGAYDFFEDSIAIGAFHAMQKGILTSHSAGNAGPSYGSTLSVAPWLISVAASTTDRLFVDKVVLGDGRTLVVCINTPKSCFELSNNFIVMYPNGLSTIRENQSILSHHPQPGFLYYMDNKFQLIAP